MRTVALLIVWTVFILYPNVGMLMISVQRAWAPPVDPSVVHTLAATLPDDPHAIEAAVNSTLVPYAVPWQTYGVPWYFPTAAEVLASGEGDCQARAVVLASILHAKGIPATFAGSFDHLWVEYPGRRPTASENAAVAIVSQTSGDTYEFRWPVVVDWRQSWEIERMYFLDSMPPLRSALLLFGWFMIIEVRWLSTRLLRLECVKSQVLHS